MGQQVKWIEQLIMGEAVTVLKKCAEEGNGQGFAAAAGYLRQLASSVENREENERGTDE